jgi:hypothetical protein
LGFRPQHGSAFSRIIQAEAKVVGAIDGLPLASSKRQYGIVTPVGVILHWRHSEAMPPRLNSSNANINAGNTSSTNAYEWTFCSP